MFDVNTIPDNPYLLLTPGPLSVSKRVKAAMLQDYCTWDTDYNELVQKLRQNLTAIATRQTEAYSTVLMQGSGTFGVESVIGSRIPSDGRLLVLSNGAYGERIADIARVLQIDCVKQDFGEVSPVDVERLEQLLEQDKRITHVAVVHCETTTGMLNDIEAIGRTVKQYGKTYIVDAMSSFGGIPFDVSDWGIDLLISSANKCIQGVPGFAFVIAKRSELEACKGQARSLSLDLYSQWHEMEAGGGKWRYTSPTHVVRAFVEAMHELEEEGGVEARYRRYKQNQETLVKGMRELGFESLLADELHSPIITAFLYPQVKGFTFCALYTALKTRGFVIYPGKISKADTFRIGNIGDVQVEDINRLLREIKSIYS